MLATPLQIANAYAALINGGTLYAPNIGLRTINPITGETEVQYDSRVTRELYLPDAFSQPIMDGLAAVTTWRRTDNGLEGTAYSAFLNFPHEDWPVSGKTGTSEKQSLDALIADYALFVGWGPNPEPEYVAVVILEEAGFGGSVAAPVVRRYFEQIAYGIVPRYLSVAEADEAARQLANELQEPSTEVEAIAETSRLGSGD